MRVRYLLVADARDVSPHLSGNGKPLVVWHVRFILQLASRCFAELCVSAVESERSQGEQEQDKICREIERSEGERERETCRRGGGGRGGGIHKSVLTVQERGHGRVGSGCSRKDGSTC